MNIKLLDSTLRDGSLAVDYTIADAIKRPTVLALENSGVDIIECGLLQSNSTRLNGTVFGSVRDYQSFTTPKKPGVLYMGFFGNPHTMQFDEIDERSDDTLVDGLRIAFTKYDIDAAFALAENVQSKGYLVMFQVARTRDYSEAELLSLIERTNKLSPWCLGIVDTNGNLRILYAVFEKRCAV